TCCSSAPACASAFWRRRWRGWPTRPAAGDGLSLLGVRAGVGRHLSLPLRPGPAQPRPGASSGGAGRAVAGIGADAGARGRPSHGCRTVVTRSARPVAFVTGVVVVVLALAYLVYGGIQRGGSYWVTGGGLWQGYAAAPPG